MSVIKRRYTANFTTIENSLFDDERLAADEVGILAYLRSRPHDWEVRRPALGRRWKMGRDAIKRVISNFVRTGWCVARRERLPNGTFHMIYEIRDEPGPTLTIEEVRQALSLVSSEAGNEEFDVNEASDAMPVTGQPPTPYPSLADPPPAEPPLAYKNLPNTDSPRTDSDQINGGGVVSASLISKHAQMLADELLVIAGHDLKFIPPGWCGAAMTVHAWLSRGWAPEAIIAGTRARMARRDGAIARSVAFFELTIADEIARQNRPVPEIPNYVQATGDRPAVSQSSSGRGGGYARILAELHRRDSTD